jgi:hypothetical protein
MDLQLTHNPVLPEAVPVPISEDFCSLPPLHRGLFAEFTLQHDCGPFILQTFWKRSRQGWEIRKTLTQSHFLSIWKRQDMNSTWKTQSPTAHRPCAECAEHRLGMVVSLGLACVQHGHDPFQKHKEHQDLWRILGTGHNT